MPKGKNEKCGGRWNMSGRCATGLNCKKTGKKSWYMPLRLMPLEGLCVNKDEAPVNVQGIKINKPVQKCPKFFRGWNTPWIVEYPLE